MARYIKQRDKFSCGPVAILNALRWAGADVSTGYVYVLSDKCRCVPVGVRRDKVGTDHYDFDRVIRQESEGLFRVDLILKPRLEEIETHLQDGGAVVLNYKHEKARHFNLLTEVSESGKTFELVNDFSEKMAVVKVRRKTFFDRCLKFNNDIGRKGWFLTKE